MKLIEALNIIKTGQTGRDEPLPVLLACGFEPLHLATFLTAHLQRRFPQRPVRLGTGLYGDHAGAGARRLVPGGPARPGAERRARDRPIARGTRAGRGALSGGAVRANAAVAAGRPYPGLADSELRAGFPYRLAHADAVAELLAALAESGVLVAVASKNDPGLVEEALRRPDLRLARDRVHPVHASWGAKSEAVGRILRAWNVAADSVVFVDDTPMELAEVATAHPGIECVRFPKDDPAAAWATIELLRDLFGKAVISEEDRLRHASLRGRGLPDPPAEHSAGFEDFLAHAAAVPERSPVHGDAVARALRPARRVPAARRL